MKKLLLIVLLNITAALVFAQTVDYGIKAGLNLSNETYSGILFGNVNGKPIAGFNIGGIADLNFHNFIIQPGIFFSTKGSRVNETSVPANGRLGGTADDKIISNYIEVPVNLLYKFSVNQNVIVHVGAGPYLSYCVSSHGWIIMNGIKEPISGNLRNPDYGFNFLVGTVICHKFIVDAQYGLGLGNLTYYAIEKNRVISLSAGYLFR